jgi:hypothetical protein
MRRRTYLNPEILVPMTIGFALGALLVLVTTAVIAQIPTVTLQPGEQVVVECVPAGPTFTPTATATATATATTTPTPSRTPTITLTPTGTVTPSPSPTPTATATGTVIPTPTITRTPIPSPLLDVWFQPLDFGDVQVGTEKVARNYIQAHDTFVWVEAVQVSAELTLVEPVPPFEVKHVYRKVDIAWQPQSVGSFQGRVEFIAGGRVVGAFDVVGNAVP